MDQSDCRILGKCIIIPDIPLLFARMGGDQCQKHHFKKRVAVQNRVADFSVAFPIGCTFFQ